ncbi:MAG: hypothetical protein HN350_21325, partial [Phycisphaerales bacterium]|nr:hypothetical protein [Phycisphaerales bacterium]
DTRTAIAMIEQSIGHGWIGLFEIKEDYSNGKHGKTRSGIGPSAKPDQEYYIPELDSGQIRPVSPCPT